MTSTPDDPFNDLDDPEKAKGFIESVTGGTVEIARARIKSELYLAHKTKTAGETLAVSVTSLTSALEEALASHADALREAAKSSEKYARWLFYATGALVLATLVLAVVTIFKG
jgi:hypothetical protein